MNCFEQAGIIASERLKNFNRVALKMAELKKYNIILYTDEQDRVIPVAKEDSGFLRLCWDNQVFAFKEEVEIRIGSKLKFYKAVNLVNGIVKSETLEVDEKYL